VRGRAARDGATTGDEGRITILVLGYFLVVAVLLGVVVGIAGVQVQRQRLFALADAAALDAADALAVEAYYGTGLEPGATALPLTDESVRASVDAHLAGVGAASRFDGLAVAGGTGTLDGVTAQVQLTAVATPPMVPRVVNTFVGGVPITVTARARSAVE